MINAPMSTAVNVPPGLTITGYHVHPKAKSNDMMGMGPHFNQSNLKIVNGQLYQIQVPNGQQLNNAQ